MSMGSVSDYNQNDNVTEPKKKTCDHHLLLGVQVDLLVTDKMPWVQKLQILMLNVI